MIGTQTFLMISPFEIKLEESMGTGCSLIPVHHTMGRGGDSVFRLQGNGNERVMRYASFSLVLTPLNVTCSGLIVLELNWWTLLKKQQLPLVSNEHEELRKFFPAFSLLLLSHFLIFILDVIAKDSKTKLRRTPKLMICLCKTSQILGIEWLEQSAKEQRVLDTDDFLLIGDKEAEKRYNFSMKETLQNGTLARSNTGGVLGGWFVYICKGVADNKAPSMKELHLLVEATGATFLRTLSESDPSKTIMITSDPATSAQRSEKGVKRVTSLGGRLLPTSWLFHTITTQKVSFDGEDKESAAMPSKQRSKQRKAAPAMGRNTRKSSQNR